MKPCDPSEAIEVMITEKEGVRVVAGHHTLGQILENIGSRLLVVEGNRQQFSTQPEELHQWELNENDLTLSPWGSAN